MRASDYPAEYREIFKEALADGVELTFSTAAKARAFRAELYKYRFAVRDELPSSRKHYDKVMQVQLSVKGKVLSLTKKKSKFVEKLNDR